MIISQSAEHLSEFYINTVKSLNMAYFAALKGVCKQFKLCEKHLLRCEKPR